MIDETEMTDFVDALKTASTSRLDKAFSSIHKQPISQSIEQEIQRVCGIYDLHPVQGLAAFWYEEGNEYRDWIQDLIADRLHMKNYMLSSFSVIDYEGWLDEQFTHEEILQLTKSQIESIADKFDTDAFDGDDAIPINYAGSRNINLESDDYDPNFDYIGYGGYVEPYPSKAWIALEKLVAESKEGL